MARYAPSGGISQAEEFTLSGTFTVPPSVFLIWLSGSGAGGGGAGGGTNYGGGGGGSGFALDKLPLYVEPADVITVTLGTPGAGGLATISGFDATDTTFGSLVTLPGGKGGVTNGGAGGAGGGSTAIGPYLLGSDGGNASNSVSPSPGGGFGPHAGGAIGAAAVTGGAGGAASYYAAGAAGGADGVGGSDATALTGAGGGGGGRNAAGGDGGRAKLLVEWIG